MITIINDMMASVKDQLQGPGADIDVELEIELELDVWIDDIIISIIMLRTRKSLEGFFFFNRKLNNYCHKAS
jgi:hypothetical protein